MYVTTRYVCRYACMSLFLLRVDSDALLFFLHSIYRDMNTAPTIAMPTSIPLALCVTAEAGTNGV